MLAFNCKDSAAEELTRNAVETKQNMLFSGRAACLSFQHMKVECIGKLHYRRREKHSTIAVDVIKSITSHLQQLGRGLDKHGPEAVMVVVVEKQVTGWHSRLLEDSA